MNDERRTTKRGARWGALICGLAMLGACADDTDDTHQRIDFMASIPALSFDEVDSGPVEVAEGVVMRTVTRMNSSWELEASGLARGDWVEPVLDSGAISTVATVEVDVYATVTIPGEEFDGLLTTETFELETDVSRFDPFLIDDPQVLGLDQPAGVEVRLDPASGTGLAFVVDAEVAMLPTYEGTCLEIDDEVAQYTLDLQPIGDIKYTYGVEMVTPVSRNRLGEIGIDIELVSAGGERVDMGTYSVHDGEPIADASLCGG